MHRSDSVSPWLFSAFMDATLNEMRASWDDSGVLFIYGETEWKLP